MGLIGKQYTSVALTADDIADGVVTSGKIADGTIVNADINASAAIAASKVLVDTSAIEDDVALLGFKVAVAGTMAKYNLVDQTEDAFVNDSGIDASASTNASRNSANYYTGGMAPSGGTITTYTSGGVDYSLHKFASGGNFSVSTSGLADILVVAGGGQGGGTHGSGGGGAGGFKYWSQTTVASGTSAVAIGVGGSGSAGDGGKGDDSQFASLSASSGGGGSGSHSSSPATQNGGSGAGASGRFSQAGGDGNANEGNDGGNATSLTGGPDDAGGGGGGASAAGTTASGTTAGNGGAGYTEGATVYDWESGSGTVTLPASFYNGSTNSSYAGGGAAGSQVGTAGSAGVGGGGAVGVDGTANTGGGGGGQGGAGVGPRGDGGSGVVILRFVDGALGASNNLTLVSNSTTANDGAPTKGDIVMTYTNGAGTATLNTDLKAYASRDGTNWTAMTLVAQGNTGSASPHFIVAAHDVDISSQPSGTSMKYKIETLNQTASKETRVQAVSLGWS
jgi:hypothetical protein